MPWHDMPIHLPRADLFGHSAPEHGPYYEFHGGYGALDEKGTVTGIIHKAYLSLASLKSIAGEAGHQLVSESDLAAYHARIESLQNALREAKESASEDETLAEIRKIIAEARQSGRSRNSKVNA